MVRLRFWAQLAAAEDHLRFLERGEVDPFALDDHGPHGDRLVADLEVDVGRVAGGYLDLEAGLVGSPCAGCGTTWTPGGTLAKKKYPPASLVRARSRPSRTTVVQPTPWPLSVVDHVTGQGAGPAAGGNRGQTQQESGREGRDARPSRRRRRLRRRGLPRPRRRGPRPRRRGRGPGRGPSPGPPSSTWISISLETKSACPEWLSLRTRVVSPSPRPTMWKAQGPSSSCCLHLGDALVADLPAQGEAFVRVGDEEGRRPRR